MPYRGVYETPGNRWRCQFCYQGKIVQVGIFPTEKEAARAWDAAAARYRGETEHLNFPNHKLMPVPPGLRKRLGSPPPLEGHVSEATISDDDDGESEKENGDSPVATADPKDSQLAHDSQMIDLEMLSQPDTFQLAAAAAAAAEGKCGVGMRELMKGDHGGDAGGEEAAGLPSRLRRTLPADDLDSLITYFRAASCHAEQDLQGAEALVAFAAEQLAKAQKLVKYAEVTKANAILRLHHSDSVVQMLAGATIDPGDAQAAPSGAGPRPVKRRGSRS